MTTGLITHFSGVRFGAPAARSGPSLGNDGIIYVIIDFPYSLIIGRSVSFKASFRRKPGIFTFISSPLWVILTIIVRRHLGHEEWKFLGYVDAHKELLDEIGIAVGIREDGFEILRVLLNDEGSTSTPVSGIIIAQIFPLPWHKWRDNAWPGSSGRGVHQSLPRCPSFASSGRTVLRPPDRTACRSSSPASGWP